jgi:cytochrome P450
LNIISRAVVNPLNHPKYLYKLRAELDATFPSIINEMITHDKVQSLSYLNTVIHESMRRIPVRGLEFDRVVPAKGATLCDHYLPGRVSYLYSVFNSLTIY